MSDVPARGPGRTPGPAGPGPTSRSDQPSGYIADVHDRSDLVERHRRRVPRLDPAPVDLREDRADLADPAVAETFQAVCCASPSSVNGEHPRRTPRARASSTRPYASSAVTSPAVSRCGRACRPRALPRHARVLPWNVRLTTRSTRPRRAARPGRERSPAVLAGDASARAGSRSVQRPPCSSGLATMSRAYWPRYCRSRRSRRGAAGRRRAARRSCRRPRCGEPCPDHPTRTCDLLGRVVVVGFVLDADRAPIADPLESSRQRSTGTMPSPRAHVRWAPTSRTSLRWTWKTRSPSRSIASAAS